MMRKILLISCMLLCAVIMRSQDLGSHFRAGADWGCGTTLLESHHFNYLSSSGYRFDDRSSAFAPHFTGHVTGYAGFWVQDNLSLTLHAGWSGLADGRRIVPVFMRTEWFFGRPLEEDSRFLLFDMGTDVLSFGRNTVSAALGAGYRILLQGPLGLGFHISLKASRLHPSIVDEDTMQEVPQDDIRDDSQSYYGLEFGISLGF